MTLELPLGCADIRLPSMNQAVSIAPSASVVAEAQRLYRLYHARCFWSYRPELVITPDRVEWVRNGLRRHGGMAGWRAAQRLAPRD